MELRKKIRTKTVWKSASRLNTDLVSRSDTWKITEIHYFFNKIPVISHQAAVPELVFTYWCLQVSAKINAFVLVKHLSELLLFSKEIIVHLLQTIIWCRLIIQPLTSNNFRICLEKSYFAALPNDNWTDTIGSHKTAWDR